VFPIRLPALRERSEDIPFFVNHFTRIYAGRMQKSIEHVSAEAMNALLKHSWPGNVRELQNLIERAVILSPGKRLQLSLSELTEAESFVDLPGQSAVSSNLTLKDAEREHIIKALAETNWVIGGTKGAAARLGLKRTTLASKMQRLGISRGPGLRTTTSHGT
jgi:formate hydrogenlyase transcriptional activator